MAKTIPGPFQAARVLPFLAPPRRTLQPQPVPSCPRDEDPLSVIPAALAALPASRVAQWARVSGKFARLLATNAAMASVLEGVIDRGQASTDRRTIAGGTQ